MAARFNSCASTAEPSSCPSPQVTRDAQGRCSVTWSDDGFAHSYRDFPFILESVTLLYRQQMSLPTVPPTTRPRLYGTDAHW